MDKHNLIIATRESPLAMWQAESVRDALLALHPHLTIQLLGITTQADRRLDINLLDIGGKGLFVKELEEALIDGRADIAVHSMKDVPMILPDGLILPVICKRADPRDVFVSNKYISLTDLPLGARVGTSSLRRQTQLRVLRPDLEWIPLRGNIQTRLRRLDEGQFDAIVLAAAGLLRLQLGNRIQHYLTIEQSLPAAGQGALGIECRAKDQAIEALIAPLNDTTTHACVQAERALCRRLGGGCKVPVAAYAVLDAGMLTLKSMISTADSSKMLKVSLDAPLAQAENLGQAAADALLLEGAGDILREWG